MLPLVPDPSRDCRLRRALDDPYGDPLDVLIDTDTVRLTVHGVGSKGARTGHVPADDAGPEGRFATRSRRGVSADNESCEHALDTLLGTRSLQTWRYADAGPPLHAVWHEEVPGARAPIGWLHVRRTSEHETGPSRRPRVTHTVSRSRGRGVSVAYLWAHPSEWQTRHDLIDLDDDVEGDDSGGVDGEVSASTQRMAAHLAGRVASTASMDLFVTRRTGLVDSSGIGWQGTTLCASPERATALLALLLRTQREYPVAPYRDAGRDLYMLLAIEALLPHHGHWAAACSQGALTGDGILVYYSEAVDRRVFQALQARDELAVVLSRDRPGRLDEADATDRFTMFLVAAFDAAAHVANELICRPKSKPHATKWQNRDFRDKLRTAAPELAGLFEHQTRGGDVLKILTSLRNCIHGGGFTRQRILVEADGIERRTSVPVTAVPGLIDAVERTRASARTADWGIHLRGEQVWIEPELLVERLLDETLDILDRVLDYTPKPRSSSRVLSDLLDADNTGDDFDERESGGQLFLKQIVDTRGSAMYRWHIGLRPL